MHFLTLIRHAKSSWDNPLLRDFDRPLNPRGKSDAPLMGEILRHANVSFDLIVSSPALRAISTAHLIAREVHYRLDDIVQKPQIYEATAATLLDIVHGFDDHTTAVAMVGHNPGLSEFANQLVREPVGELPTCAVVRIGFDADAWAEIQPGDGKLIAFDYPKKHKRG